MRLHKSIRRSLYTLLDSITLTEEQQMIKSTALSFAKESIAPFALEWDAKAHFPRETYKAAADLGFAGTYLPEDVGGSGLSRHDASLVFEALAYGCPSLAAYLSIHNMVNWVISSFGAEETRQEFCRKLCTLEYLGAYCLTEPGSGSDAAAMSTVAVEDGDDYVLSGKKMFVSGVGQADIYLIFALTPPKEVSVFIVPKDTNGLSTAADQKKMGWRSVPASILTLNNCRVNKRLMVGHKGDGFRYAMQALTGERLYIASASLGGAQFAYDKAVEYTADRKQFGKPLADFQNTQFKLAEFATKLTASRLLVRAAARSMDENSKDKVTLSSMAKFHATEQCYEIADGCLQLFGGYGYLHEYGVEKIVRDLRCHRLAAGTNEIMRSVVAKQLTKI